jgi:hypothetical protein
LLGEVDQRAGRCDVWVEIGVVGMGVVPVVLVQPPPHAQAKGEVAVHETEQVAAPSGAGDLLVAQPMSLGPVLPSCVRSRHERTALMSQLAGRTVADMTPGRWRKELCD